MKKIYLTFSLFTLTSILNAQPVIQASDLNPTIGETFTSYLTNHINEGNSGNNVTWDLSGLVSSSTHDVKLEDLNNGFPSSNVTYNFDNSSSKMYQLNNSIGQQVYGQLLGTTLISFSNPMQIMVFPLNSSVDNDDTHTATFTSGGYPFTRTGTTNVKYDGWGTLITPEGTFQNVIRVCLTQIYTDTYLGGTLDYNVVAYAWYKAGIHKELASLTTFETFQGTSTYGTYLETSGLEIKEIEETQYSISPNPFNDKLNISLKDNKDIKSIQLINCSGNNILDFPIQEELNVENISSGVYILKIQTEDGNIIQKKIIKL